VTNAGSALQTLACRTLLLRPVVLKLNYSFTLIRICEQHPKLYILKISSSDPSPHNSNFTHSSGNYFSSEGNGSKS
jgi:hypothetical protein